MDYANEIIVIKEMIKDISTSRSFFEYMQLILASSLPFVLLVINNMVTNKKEKNEKEHNNRIYKRDYYLEKLTQSISFMEKVFNEYQRISDTRLKHNAYNASEDIKYIENELSSSILRNLSLIGAYELLFIYQSFTSFCNSIFSDPCKKASIDAVKIDLKTFDTKDNPWVRGISESIYSEINKIENEDNRSLSYLYNASTSLYKGLYSDTIKKINDNILDMKFNW